jgi:protein-S-isoprenylcysteine O-methyltransferase Ste14
MRVDAFLIRWIWYGGALLWLVMAFRTKRTLIRQRGALRLAIVVLAVALVGSSLLPLTSIHRRLWAPSVLLSDLSLAIVMAGAACGVWARLTIGTNWSGVVTFKEDHELIQSGPYRFVRHPIYTALLFMGLGSALDYGRLYGFILLVLAAGALIWKMRLEEKLMTEHFPERYPAYRRRVKALVPFIF